MPPRVSRALIYALLPTTGLVAWCLATQWQWVRPLFLPHPLDVIEAADRLYETGALWDNATASTLRILWGFLLTFAFAFPVGALMGLSESGRRLVQPLNSLFRYMPFPAFVPLLILWFGIGTTTQISVIFVGTFFQLAVLIQNAFSDIHEEYVETARSLSFSPARMFISVELPAALPQCYDAVRTAIGWAWTCLIVAEMVGASDGLGYMIIVAQRFLKTPEVFVGILVIGLIGLTIDLFLAAARPYVVPWASQIR